MTDLAVYVVNQIKNVTNKVYPEFAPSEETFPYVIYKFPSTNELSVDSSNVIMEIDIWDRARSGHDSFADIERLTTAIDVLFKDARYIDEKMFLIIQKLSRMSIPDTDPSIRRRQLRYNIKMYQR